MSLPDDRDARNALPVWDGCMAYFPDCWAEIAKVSVLGNKQHGLGEKLHFNRDVSTDHANKVMRHMLDHAAGKVLDTDGTYHLAKAAWRALAALQVAIEARVATQCQQAMPDYLGRTLQDMNTPVPWNHHSDCPCSIRNGLHPARDCICGAGPAVAQSAGLNPSHPGQYER